MLSLKALPEQVGHLDEELTAIAMEASLEEPLIEDESIIVQVVEAVVIKVVVISNIKRRSRIRGPAKQQLSLYAGLQRIVVNSCPSKCETSELVGSAKYPNVVVKRYFPCVVTNKARLCIADRHV